MLLKTPYVAVVLLLLHSRFTANFSKKKKVDRGASITQIFIHECLMLQCYE